MTQLDAVYAFVAAFVVTVLLTRPVARLARSVGAVDQPKARGLGRGAPRLLGGLAIGAGVLIGGLLFLEPSPRTHDRLLGILGGGALIPVVGALDDRFALAPPVKLLGQLVA